VYSIYQNNARAGSRAKAAKARPGNDAQVRSPDMNVSRREILGWTAAASSAALLPGWAVAQGAVSFAGKTVEWTIPFGEGGGSDARCQGEGTGQLRHPRGGYRTWLHRKRDDRQHETRGAGEDDRRHPPATHGQTRGNRPLGGLPVRERLLQRSHPRAGRGAAS